MGTRKAADDDAQLQLPGLEAAAEAWQHAYDGSLPDRPAVHNRSHIEIEPLYTPTDWHDGHYMRDLGFPGDGIQTRGAYTSMHRGRPWSPRLVVGFGRPEDYNSRMRMLYEAGVHGLYLAPCNAHMRGHDADAVDPALIGNCGTSISTVDDVERCLDGLPIERQSISLGDCAPYTLSAMVLAVAKRRGIPWKDLRGTTNQSDYLSHYAALHMFFRISLPGQRRLLLDHIEFMTQHAPHWNPLSVVGQHMQQAGATPAESMGLTLCSAIQHAEDLIDRGHAPDAFLPRFSFFFDVSISFFEEIAKLRAGRRLWTRIARQRLGAEDPKSWRFRFHAQTSGVDLTRQQPLNNVARVAVQGMAGIFGGLQSLHTDAYDEALGPPTAEAAAVAAATQNILRHEAGLDQVIGGSYYVEFLTNRMEAEIAAVISRIDDAGGMYGAVESGLVQRMIGDSAAAYQAEIDTGQRLVVGVNAYRTEEDRIARPASQPRLSRQALDEHLATLAAFKANRDQGAVRRSLDAIAAAAADKRANVYDRVVKAVTAGATHGEVCDQVRESLGFGDPLLVA